MLRNNKACTDHDRNYKETRCHLPRKRSDLSTSRFHDLSVTVLMCFVMTVHTQQYLLELNGKNIQLRTETGNRIRRRGGRK
jgi:hypothetical protein